MNMQLSFYLDLLRFVSAVLVFFSHVSPFIGGYLWQVGGLGHESVVVFFVLSGFVIAYVCYERKESCFDYVVNRVSRIYSVAIPAIVITFLTYFFLDIFHPNILADMNQPFYSFFRTFMTAVTFTNQSWFSTTIYVNLPYWSMGYEVLYYIFFGCFFYAKGFKRIVFLVFVIFVMGPSIFMYLPIWLAGVLCFKLKDKADINRRTAISGFVLSIIGISLCCINSLQVYINQSNVFFSSLVQNGFVLDTAKYVLSDYLLAFFVFINVIFANVMFDSIDFKIATPCYKLIKTMSSHTFSLYLLHMPLLYLARAALPQGSFYFSLLLFIIIVPVLIFMISMLIEKERPKFRSLLARVFDGLFCNSRLKRDNILN